MTTTITSKGQVTIPKQVRDALSLTPGSEVVFEVNDDGDVVLRKHKPRARRKADRFDAVRGKAQIRWRTDALMALLRDE